MKLGEETFEELMSWYVMMMAYGSKPYLEAKGYMAQALMERKSYSKAEEAFQEALEFWAANQCAWRSGGFASNEQPGSFILLAKEIRRERGDLQRSLGAIPKAQRPRDGT